MVRLKLGWKQPIYTALVKQRYSAASTLELGTKQVELLWVTYLYLASSLT